MGVFGHAHVPLFDKPPLNFISGHLIISKVRQLRSSHACHFQTGLYLLRQYLQTALLNNLRLHQVLKMIRAVFRRRRCCMERKRNLPKEKPTIDFTVCPSCFIAVAPHVPIANFGTSLLFVAALFTNLFT